MAYRKYFMQFTIMLALLGILCPAVSGQTYNYNTTTASGISKAAKIKSSGLPTLTVWNNDWKNMKADASWRNVFKFKSVTDIVQFSVDYTYTATTAVAYTYKMAYEMRGYTSTDTSTYVSTYDTLTIGYNPDSLSSSQDVQIKKFSGYYKTIVIVNALFDITDSTVAPVLITPSHLTNLNFFIESSISTQKYDLQYPYRPSTPVLYYGTGTGALYTSWNNANANSNYLDVYFNISGYTNVPITPVSYELEWTYVDDYQRNIYTDSVTKATTSQLSFDFRHNCTRVWLDTPHYLLPLTYPSGYIVFRARMIRPDSSLYRYPVYSDWTYSVPDSGQLSTLSSPSIYPMSSPYTNDSLNWQYTASFAENGKYKHVVSFYDGLLKNRESITRFNNTPSKLIVTQNIYDFEGRPSIKILPSSVSSASFSYQHNVSLNGSTHLPYKAGDFDTIRLQSCPAEAMLAPLDTNALASIYYSKRTPDTTAFRQFIPDAEGYPMVQTIYAPIFNDRIEKQGGAGLLLQIADSNIINNDYVGANQEDLNSMFGPNIGWSGFYTKTVSRDPNRQLSLAIKDYKGRQIATSMVGTGPNSINHAIVPVDNLPGVQYYQEDLIASSPQKIIGHNRILDKDFYMDAEGNDTIQYVYSFTPYPTGCSNSYLSIKASYAYNIIDQCGIQQFARSGTIGNTGVVTTATPVPYTGSRDALFLGQGKFNLHKTLFVNINDVYAAVDSFMYKPNCLHDLPYFVRQTVEAQKFPCPSSNTDECAAAKNRMMQELYPGAKYGKYSFDGVTGLVKGDTNSIFTDSVDNGGYHGVRYRDTCIVKLPDSVIGPDGVYYKNLRTVGVDTFIYVFNDQIAETLLPLHPEFCKLANCFPDSFKTQVMAIPDYQTADHLQLLLLDSLISKDPIKAILASKLSFVSPKDSLAKFMGQNIRLDSMAIMKAYCGCSDSIMFRECLAHNFGYEIANRLLTNNFVKSSYFNDVRDLYFQNRERFKQMITGNTGNTCGPCLAKRMHLVPLPVFPTYYSTSGRISTAPGSVFSSFGGGSSLLTTLAGAMDSAATISPDTLTKLGDSAAALIAADDSSLCLGQIDTVLSRLTNCIAYSTTLSAALRNTFDSLCTAKQVQYGNFTPDQVRYVLIRNGISPNDLCNQYLVSYNNLYPTSSSGANCKPASFYSDLKAFLNRTATISAFVSSASTTPSTGAVQTYTLLTSNIFEDSVSKRLGTTSTSMAATYASTGNMYTLRIYSTTIPNDTVKVYLRGTDTSATYHNIFLGPTDTFKVTSVICVNDQPNHFTSGYISDFSFIASVQHSAPGILKLCSMLGWADSVETMDYSGNIIAGCVPCTQMKSLYTQFLDTMLILGVKGTDHPYYETMLAHFMNYNLGTVYTSTQYKTFISSCALADSMKLPQYVAYGIAIFPDSATTKHFVDSVNSIDISVGLDPAKETFVNGTKFYRVFIDFNQIPLTKLYKYKALLARYSTYGYTTYTNQLYSSLQAANTLGVIFTPASYHFIPNATSIFGSGTGVTFSDSSRNGYWTGTRYSTQNYYYVYEPGGASPYQISRDAYTLQQYIVNNKMPSTFVSNYQSTIDNDYFKAEKQGYLKYAYANQALPSYEVLDSLQAQYLMTTRVPALDTEQVSYTRPSDPNTVTNLYAINTAGTNRMYDTLRKILNLVTGNTVNPGGIYFDTNLVIINTDLQAYRCSDGSYWYRYFCPHEKDTMYNVYVKMPGYIPRYMHKYYQIKGIYSVPSGVAPMPGDSTSRFFVLKMAMPTGDTTTITASGMTDFVIGKNIELDNVLLAGDMRGGSSSTGSSLDTFLNCERTTLQSAVRTAAVTYKRYLDSVHNSLNLGFMDYVMNHLNEQLNIGYRDQQFNTTLYMYDRAGNLTETVPPQGVAFLATSKLRAVDTMRINDTGVNPSLIPTHTKVTNYYYNALNQLTSQQTPDAGKTRFFYDAEGKVIFSQNAQQAPIGAYTYNLYDDQDRLIETGQAGMGSNFDEFIFIHSLDPTGSTLPHQRFVLYFRNVPTHDGDTVICSPHPEFIYDVIHESMPDLRKMVRSFDRTDVVMTIYDTASAKLGTIPGLDNQTNLRKRVAGVKYFEMLSSTDIYFSKYNYATHYSYDVDGNVKMLVQDCPALDSFRQRYKRIDYDYDLISGKVNMLSYNRGHQDQYYQTYSYDADNRIVQVQSSNDGYIWENDANYSYYDHGPLARVALGAQNVQGVDYAYTIQGWLKAVNGDTLNGGYDMGGDGSNNSAYARDVVAATIDYFSGDYKPARIKQPTHLANPALSLYNGNISRQTVAIAPFQRLSKQYIYDQLNRINKATYSSVAASNWALADLNKQYYNHYKYDQDGNLLQLVRYGPKTTGSAGVLMDSLTYFYPGGSNPTNKLMNVTDSAADVFTNDIKHSVDSGGKSRYLYDNIGNTTKDLVDGQDSITWNLYNKVHTTNNAIARNNMRFLYDGAGNRVAKYFYQNSDTGSVEDDNFYVHDAQGNILAVYRMNKVWKIHVDGLDHQNKPGGTLGIGGINSSGRTGSGGSHTFNTNVTLPLFSLSPQFRQSLINYCVQSSNLLNTELTSRNAGFYLTRSPAILRNLLNYTTTYIRPMLSYEKAHTGVVLSPAIDSIFVKADLRLGNQLLTALFSHADTNKKRHLIGLMCSTGDDSMINSLAAMTGSYVPSTCDSVARSISQNMPQPFQLAGMFNTLAAIYPSKFATYSGLLAADTSIYNDSFYVQNNTGVMLPVIQNVLSYYGDSAQAGKYFNTWGSAMPTIRVVTDTPSMLRVVYDSDPLTFINNADDALGDAYIDTAMAASPYLDIVGYAAAVSAITSTTIPTVTISNVLNNQNFWLAEHDLYGSSRLGIKQYWPTQFLEMWDYTKSPVLIDSMRLQGQIPWYSAEYQDDIIPTVTTPYGNTSTAQQLVSHQVGLKQYELTDHLGDVLATVSDKRKAVDTDANGSIDRFYACIPAAYDYYPFGMLMPNRYISDTTQHCALITQSIMIPKIVNNTTTFTSCGACGWAAFASATLTINPSSITVNAPTPGGLATNSIFAMPGSGTLTLNVSALSGAFWNVNVTDTTGTSIGSGLIQGASAVQIPYSGSASATVNYALISTGGSSVTLTSVSIGSVTYVPGITVVTACNKTSDFYRYGFNGKLKDNEWAGIGNHVDYGERGLDTRVPHWFTPDKLYGRHPSVSPYAYVRDNPIIQYDPDGKTDYSATVSQAKNGREITKTVTVEVNYGILNISGNDLYNSASVSGEGYHVKTFSGSFTSKDAKGNKVTVNVATNVHYHLINNINELKKGENIMLIVDKIPSLSTDKAKGEKIGRAQFEGTAMAIPYSHINDRPTIEHEQGHNFGFYFPNNSDDPTHSSNPGNLMFGIQNGQENVSEDDLKGIYSNLVNKTPGKYDVKSSFSTGDVKKDAQNFLDKTTVEYDKNKANKAGLH